MVFLAVLGAIGSVFQGIFIVADLKKQYKKALLFKALASFMFFFLGLLCLIVRSALPLIFPGMIVVVPPSGLPPAYDAETARLIVIGLALGGLGDFFLNFRYLVPKLDQALFLTGTAVFLSGHVMYFIARVQRLDNVLLPVIIGLVVAAVILVIIIPRLTLTPVMKVFGILYLSFFSVSTAVACQAMILNPATHYILFFTGSLLFLTSDVVLSFYTFREEKKVSLDISNLILYYLGQLLIAFSIYFL